MTHSPKSSATDSPAGSRTDGYLNLTEDAAKHALIEARGDIFIASQLLGITALRLDRAIQMSPALSTVREAIKIKGQHSSVSNEELAAAVERRLSMYRVVGLDALHDLATMPIAENSAQNQVKLAAAARLAGPTEGLNGGGEMAETLRLLNDQYQKEAPRLRVTRERITFETVPEKTVGQGSPE